MKSFALLAAVCALGLTLVTGDAEAARRLGGGRSSGMQREAVTAPKPTTPTAPAAAPHQNAAPTPGPVPQAQPKRSWMGPLAGLAAGLGLAALASHLGFGEGLANLMLIGLIIMAVMLVLGVVMRRRAAAQAPGALQYAGAGYGGGNMHDFQPAGRGMVGGSTARSGNIPADFDVEGFVRSAKVNFIRLQAANDAGNLDDLREFMTPEMFSEAKMDILQRGQGSQQTDVVQLDAEVLDVAEEAARYVASVRFHGLIRETGEAAAPFDEIWNMVKPRDGSRGWVVAGIQQVQ